VRYSNFRNTALILLSFLLASGYAFALNATTHTKHHHRRARRIVWNPLLRGSYESLLRQNEEIDRLHLPRIVNDEELADLEAREELVPITEAPGLTVASNLEPSRRYCRPWTRGFLSDLGQAYYEEFHRPIEVTSAVRTVEQQRKLRRHNRNAAPETGENASSHLAGLTVDILKRGMTRRQHQWVEQYFYKLKQQRLIEPAEERRQPVFHVMVSDRYTDWRSGGVEEKSEPGPTLPAVQETTVVQKPTAD
jgi:hypothetical protein